MERKAQSAVETLNTEKPLRGPVWPEIVPVPAQVDFERRVAGSFGSTVNPDAGTLPRTGAPE